MFPPLVLLVAHPQSERLSSSSKTLRAVFVSLIGSNGSAKSPFLISSLKPTTIFKCLFLFAATTGATIFCCYPNPVRSNFICSCCWSTSAFICWNSFLSTIISLVVSSGVVCATTPMAYSDAYSEHSWSRVTFPTAWDVLSWPGFSFRNERWGAMKTALISSQSY